jgi:uncharacterized protein YyaL (SSP411 family)
MPNRLINQTSPYLLQHANNPVDWYPWGEEALTRAKTENKPLLVSIGYAACHWCHVMERESFENEEIAGQMNESFVCVKVDREERPDIDAIYMQAVQALTGHGGWPLTVFLTPDARPFYGGTYFPPDDRHGMPGFPRLLEALSTAYKDRQGEVLQSAETITSHLQSAVRATASTDPLQASIFTQAALALEASFDDIAGGFGGAPKFPQPMPQEYLLRHHHRTGDPTALSMAEQALQAMAHGGIYDHLGGGFHRYSTDAQWLVPHFEKMLYDNALLARLYLHAYQVTGNGLYRRVVEETLDYLLREMRHPDGGFYSSQDADSEGEEGKYYVWHPHELADLLGQADAELFSSVYGVTWEGNFEGRNIAYLPIPLTEAAEALGTTEAELSAKLAPIKAKLLAARDQRIHPPLDDKVLTSWNALALRAFAEAGSVLGNERYREAAEVNGAFLLDHLHQDGRLLRTWKDGRAHLNGYLEDYAFLITALLSLHEATQSHRWLHAAKQLTDEMLTLFWSETDAVLYDTGNDHEQLIVRPRDFSDNAIPSGSSVAAEALLLMASLTGDEDYSRKAVLLLRTVRDYMTQYPSGFGHWLCALDVYLSTPTEVAVVGPPNDSATQALLEQIYKPFSPSLLLVALDPAEANPFASPILESRNAANGLPTAYVCHHYVCQLPTNSPDVLAAQLAERA